MSTAQRLRHEAYFYDSTESYLETLVPYLLDGLEAGEAVVVVVPERNAHLLRMGLGVAVADMTFLDAAEWYRRPVQTIAQYHDVIRSLDGAPARVVGEVAFGDTESSWAEWTRYESVLNDALAGAEARVLCPYDVRTLPDRILALARCTHPLVHEAGEVVPCAHYLDPVALIPRLAFDVAVPEAEPALDLEVGGDLRAARADFVEVVRGVVHDGRTAELALAVNEVLTNALLHGAGPARLRVWVGEPGSNVVCAVDDAGSGISSPVAGFVPVDERASGGRGLWMARQLFDRVELGSVEGGFRVLLTCC